MGFRGSVNSAPQNAKSMWQLCLQRVDPSELRQMFRGRQSYKCYKLLLLSILPFSRNYSNISPSPTNSLYFSRFWTALLLSVLAPLAKNGWSLSPSYFLPPQNPAIATIPLKLPSQSNYWPSKTHLFFLASFQHQPLFATALNP